MVLRLPGTKKFQLGPKEFIASKNLSHCHCLEMIASEHGVLGGVLWDAIQSCMWMPMDPSKSIINTSPLMHEVCFEVDSD